MSKQKMPKYTEKRHYQRLDCELPVVLETNGQKIKTTAENVSCGGMFLPFENGEVIKDQEFVTFIQLPNRSEAIRLAAKVRRLEKDLTDKVKGIAVEFQGLYDNNRLEIDRYVKGKLLN